MPFRLSRQHFVITRSGGAFLISDLGSALGTIVNGQAVGRHFTKDSAPLHRGDNQIIAGGLDSPFKFLVSIRRLLYACCLGLAAPIDFFDRSERFRRGQNRELSGQKSSCRKEIASKSKNWSMFRSKKPINFFGTCYRAFSSEAGPGTDQENAANQRPNVAFQFHRTGKRSRLIPPLIAIAFHSGSTFLG